MATLLEIALAYVAQGWAVVPIAYREKKPSLVDWPKLRINADDAELYFNGGTQNIGVLLGDPSHGLTDIDLDCEEAVRAAAYLLPRTRCFGRASKRASHWLFYTDLAQSADRATLQWRQGPRMSRRSHRRRRSDRVSRIHASERRGDRLGRRQSDRDRRRRGTDQALRAARRGFVAGAAFPGARRPS